MLKKWIWLVTTLILLASVPAHAGDDSGWENFVQGIGRAVYFAAFPTATYKGVEFKTVRPGDNGAEVVFVVYGISAFDDDNLWTEVIITVRGSSVVDLRWGRNNAILSQPGQTMKNLGALLDDLNKQSQAGKGSSFSSPPPSASSSVVRLTWVLPNNCGYREGIQVRFFDRTKNFTWPNESNRVFILPVGETREFSIDTYRGDKVCIGAARNVASSASYWGVGLDNEYGCEDCCYTAVNDRVRWALTCN